MVDNRGALRDVDDALLTGVFADQVISGLARGGLDQRGRYAAEALTRFAQLAIAFRTGGLSAITQREVSAPAVYSLFARAAAQASGSDQSVEGLRRYAGMLSRATQLGAEERKELNSFLESLAVISLEGARSTAGALLSGGGEHRGRPWTRS